MSAPENYISAVLLVGAAGFWFRIGWALGGSVMRWMGAPDPVTFLTITNILPKADGNEVSR